MSCLIPNILCCSELPSNTEGLNLKGRHYTTQHHPETPLGSCTMIAMGLSITQSPHLLAVIEVTPELSVQLTGMVFYIPTFNLSVLDLTHCLKKAARYDKNQEDDELYIKWPPKRHPELLY